MEAEIVVLVHNYQELFSIIHMASTLGSVAGLSVGETTMKVSI